jgi:phospholipid/cholesterol/gamma-HCH transport system substrate-binding protein
MYNTDVISSKTSGLLGEKSVAITPKPLKAGEPLIIVNDQILFADESGGVEDTLNEIRKVTTTFDTVMISLTDSINEIKNQKIWETAGDTLRNVHDITAALNKPDELAETLINLRDTTARLLKSFDTIDSILVSGQKIGSNSERIVKGILEGEGSLGRILRRDEFYVNTNALLAKANTILNDINHYGLLFSSDKGWQRLRARRMNLLNQLSTPQEFRNYFNDELDQVATSLSRVSNVLEETESLGPCFNLVANSEYAKVFGELLRRVATLDESIKMFNLQLVERDLKQFELEPCE